MPWEISFWIKVEMQTRRRLLPKHNQNHKVRLIHVDAVSFEFNKLF
jgi:hypothetical protein